MCWISPWFLLSLQRSLRSTLWTREFEKPKHCHTSLVSLSLGTIDMSPIYKYLIFVLLVFLFVLEYRDNKMFCFANPVFPPNGPLFIRNDQRFVDAPLKCKPFEKIDKRGICRFVFDKWEMKWSSEWSGVNVLCFQWQQKNFILNEKKKMWNFTKNWTDVKTQSTTSGHIIF